jgi:phosphoribosylanthranilate isomerase
LQIKICGIMNGSDGRMAAELGAHAVGINFYRQSPRWVDEATAAAIVRALPPFVAAVGVFVNEPLQSAFEAANRVGRIQAIQWHGEHREISAAFPFHVIAAFSVSNKGHLVEITRYLETCRSLNKLPAAVLLDARVEGQYGGTGQTAPWRLLADFDPGVPVILAGGLTPENVADAIRIVRPYGVDVASGVESQPGRKDAERVRRFIENAREASTWCPPRDTELLP